MAAKARADQSGPLAQAEAQLEVVRRQTELAVLEAGRREKELLASTIKPAEADAQAAVTRAEGDKTARIALAEAEARRLQLAGEAEARVVLTKGQAEAEALALKAEAYQQFNQAALLSAVLERMPAIVRATAEPMANIGSLTVVSTDGASDLVRTTTETVAQANATIKGMTGIDIASLIGSTVSTSGGERRPASARKLTHKLGEQLAAGPEPGRTPKPAAKPPTAAAKESGSATQPAAIEAPTIAERPAAVEKPAEVAPPAPVEKPAEAAATPPPALAQLGSTRAEAGRSVAAVAAVLREVAPQLARIPGANTPVARSLKLSDLATSAPAPIRELWSRYADRIPEQYRGMTVGQVLDMYGG